MPVEKKIHIIKVKGYQAIYSGYGGKIQLGTYGSFGVEQIKLELGEDWANRVVYINFVPNDEEAVSVLVPETGIVDVPPDVTVKKGDGNIVVDGTEDGVRVFTFNVGYTVYDRARVDELAPPITPDRWEQFVTQVQDIVDEAVPPNGTPGYVLTKTDDGTAWKPPQGGSGGGSGGTITDDDTGVVYDVAWHIRDGYPVLSFKERSSDNG